MKLSNPFARCAGTIGNSSLRFALLAIVIGCAANLRLQAATFSVLNQSDSGVGSLRQAIVDANAVGSGTITFSNVSGSINLDSALPPLGGSIVIFGPGRDQLQISGANKFQVFRVLSVQSTASIFGLTITAGRSAFCTNGGGIANFGNLTLSNCTVRSSLSVTGAAGGGIFNSGTMKILDCAVTDNSTDYSGLMCNTDYLLGAGGIYNVGSMKIFRSSVEGNRTSRGDGGGILNEGQLEIVSSTITGNSSAASDFSYSALGGGINSRGGSLMVTNCVVSNNGAYGGRNNGPLPYNPEAQPGYGGGVYLNDGSAAFVNCTFTDNQVVGGFSIPYDGGHSGSSGLDAYGGGLYIANGTVLFQNCTIANNTARGLSGTTLGNYGGSGGSSFGAGFYQYNGSVLLVNCTISGNENRGGNAGGGGIRAGTPGNGGGAAYVRSGACTFTNCTVASNKVVVGTGPGFPSQGGNYGDGITGSGSVSLMNNILSGQQFDIAGSFVSSGFNLISSRSSSNGLSPSDIFGVPAKLGPLQDNGGPTWTHALLQGSPAIDAGRSTAVNTDQRGLPRRIHQLVVPNRGGDGSDIGAFEADNLITGIQKIGTNVRVLFMTASNRTYRVEYGAAPTNSVWTALQSNIVGNGTFKSVTNVGAGTLPRRFYRVVQN